MSGSIVGALVVTALVVVSCSSSRDFREGSEAAGGEQAGGGTTGSGSSASLGGDASSAGGDPSGAGGDPSGAGGEGLVRTLECPLGCLPPAPPGWTGPSAVYDGPEDERPDTCPDEYSLEEVEAHQGMTAEAAECECAAGTPLGAECTVRTTTYQGTTCGTAATGTVRDLVLSTSDPCVVIGGVRLRITPQPVDLSNASCAFDAPSVDLPPAEFERVNLACGLPVSAACAANPDCTAAPLPSSPFGRLCIHKQGVHDCPGAGYGARFVAYGHRRWA